MAYNEDNSGLYFIVGALLVAVVVILFLYMGDDSPGVDNDGPDSLTVIEETVNPPDDDNVNFDLNLGDGDNSADVDGSIDTDNNN